MWTKCAQQVKSSGHEDTEWNTKQKKLGIEGRVSCAGQGGGAYTWLRWPCRTRARWRRWRCAPCQASWGRPVSAEVQSAGVSVRVRDEWRGGARWGAHEPLVAREEHRGQHGLVEQAVAHPLAHDHIHLRARLAASAQHRREVHLLHAPLHQRDHCTSQARIVTCTRICTHKVHTLTAPHTHTLSLSHTHTHTITDSRTVFEVVVAHHLRREVDYVWAIHLRINHHTIQYTSAGQYTIQ